VSSRGGDELLEGGNGIWLRRLHGPLEDGTDDLQAYFDHGSSNEKAWAGRAMHWNYDGRYRVKVSAAMAPIGVYPLLCRAHKSMLGWNAIHTNITNELTSGQIPGIPSGRPGR
jgi:hypothetical protein